MATRGAFVGPGRQNSFALDVRAFVEKAKGNAELAARKVVIEVVNSLVLKSPVDTGRFRANWNISYGTPVQTISDATDKSGSGAIQRGTAVGLTFPIGQTVWITNALPYALPLEYGSSKQAPNGMVRRTQAEFQGLVAALAGQVNR